MTRWGLAAACAVALAAAAQPAASQSLDPSKLVATPASAPLTEFQWAVTEGRGMVLAPHPDGGYRPARLTGDGVLESLPPQVELQFHGEDGKTRVAVTDLVSPFEVSRDGWRLEKREGDDWVVADAFVFQSPLFYALFGRDAFLSQDPAELRFIKPGGME